MTERQESINTNIIHNDNNININNDVNHNNNNNDKGEIIELKENCFTNLPEKVLFNIFAYLDKDSFLVASQVCQLWNKVISENIEFFSSYFADYEGEEEESVSKEEEESQKMKFVNEENGMRYSEEQKQISNQINSFKSHQVYEMLGVSEQAEDEEIRTIYKKMALLVHPDRNRAPGATQAFQTLKRSFDAIMSGVNPDDRNNASMNCPSVKCGEVGTSVYFPADKQKMIMQGRDVGYCRACKSHFGRVFCIHCFSAWTMPIIESMQGTLATCSVCYKQFAILFPKPAPRSIVPPSISKSSRPNQPKKQKTWWQG